MHLRDLPETDLLHRLQALCSAHQEFTLLSKRYETASPVGDHPCPRFDDPVPPSSHCRPPRELSPPSAAHHFVASASTHHSHSTHGHARSHVHHARQHQHQHHQRQRSKSRDKRLHDECFDSDVHRLHHGCKDQLLGNNSAGSCDEDYDFKSKYC